MGEFSVWRHSRTVPGVAAGKFEDVVLDAQIRLAGAMVQTTDMEFTTCSSYYIPPPYPEIGFRPAQEHRYHDLKCPYCDRRWPPESRPHETGVCWDGVNGCGGTLP